MHARHAFTLIEVLVVVAILALLAAILLPSISRAADNAKRVVCQNNLRQIGTASYLYANDNRERFAISYDGRLFWMDYLSRHSGHKPRGSSGQVNICVCPKQVLPVEAADIQVTYGAHIRLLPDLISGPPAISRALVKRQTQVILLADASQLENCRGNSWSTLSKNGFKDCQQSRGLAETVSNAVNADNIGGALRYRHRNRANVVMVDGHVESIEFGRLRYGNVFPEGR